MLILALDTTTRGGSLALVRDGRLLETSAGDPTRTHATRLPGAILECLVRHHLTLDDVDLYGVAVGPGSFTGLRIGIATIQGLAFAHGRAIVGVSALDALAEAAGPPPSEHGLDAWRAAWMDAQRDEVYGRLFRAAGTTWQPVCEPAVGRPSRVLEAWSDLVAGALVEFVGDGAVAYATDLQAALDGRVRVLSQVPLLSPAIAAIAGREHAAGRAVPPAAVQPLYVRRPDAELARDRRATGPS